MKRLGSIAMLVLLVAACENNRSKLDNVTKPPPPQKGDTAQGTPPTAEKFKIDRTGSVEQRVARLEDYVEKNAEAIDFLGKVYAQQKAQQQQQERDEPAEDAVFAVDITPDIKAGQVEGPATGAYVTIVEAWDFA
jgi:hypothetical protein